MSDVKLYRNRKRFSVCTPDNISPTLNVEYYTPINNNKLQKSNARKNIIFSKSPRLSADCFLQKEKLKNKFRFYTTSPRTPLYKRCQVIKKRLIFDDLEDETSGSKQNNANKTKQECGGCQKVRSSGAKPRAIPKIVLTCPDEDIQKQTVAKNPFSKYSRDNFTLQSLESGMLSPEKVKLIEDVFNNDNHKVLGKGRYGLVIEETYKGIKVAIKMIDISKRGIKVSLVGEQNGLGLSHINLMRSFFILQPSHTTREHHALVVMEHIHKAINLQSLLDSDYDDRFLMPQRIIRYSIHICEGLNYLHNKKILHLDIKPRNIIICPSDVCKLCDFGTSVYFGTKIKWNTKDLLYQFRGTVRYCAPELLCGIEPTRASDIYSLGITMWQLLHRTIPYGNFIREESLIYRVVREDLRPETIRSLTYFDKLYSDLYKTCWTRDMLQRNNIHSILQKLYVYKHSYIPSL